MTRLAFDAQTVIRQTSLLALAGTLGLFLCGHGIAEETTEKKESKFRKFADVIKDAEKIDGLFTMYRKDEHLYAVIKPQQLDQSYLAPITIARGMASAGTPLNFGDEWVVSFHRVGDKIQLVRENIHYEAPDGTPLNKAVEQNYVDSVLMALPIIADRALGDGVVIDFADIFLTNFANLSLGQLDRNRTSWHQVKGFENNIELQVKATFDRGRFASFGFFGDDGVADSRGVTLVIHYSLAKRPDSGYKPRVADQRVGHFISATKDYGSDNLDTAFVRRINRWQLEKADADADLSPPKKQIIWWVEDTVPHEYRPFVEEGILEWNKAFEKIGFRNAIGVRWQDQRDSFDPEDINYCTFRWVTTPYTYARSGLRADPITGQMIDGDVVFDASWIRFWKQSYAIMVGAPLQAAAQGSQQRIGQPLAVGEIISPIMAAQYGYGLPFNLPAKRTAMTSAEHSHSENTPQVFPSSWGPMHIQLKGNLSPANVATCQYAVAKRHEFRLAAMAMAARSQGSPGAKRTESNKAAKETDDKEDEEDGDDDEKEEEEDEDKFELPEEFIGQAIKEIVMHEVGHSLGLRHNFRASSMLTLDEVNDKSITREKGMSGSVMDYNPINIAPPDEEQGDFATTTIGPYDYWAIEYAYKPISGSDEKELKKIAARSPEADLTYATDEDLWMSSDPRVHTFDLGADPMAFGRQRLEMAKSLLPDLDENLIEEGQSWARLRTAFSVLLGQYGSAAYLASSYIGGQSFSRDFRDDKDSHDPIVPISGEKQREALEFLTNEILSDDAFEFSPELLRRLTMESWYHWGSYSSWFFGGVEYPINERILSIQRIVLNHCLNANVLTRIANHRLLVNDGEDPLESSEVFRELTNSIWSKLSPKDEELSISPVQRNLQREHLQKLSRIVLGPRQNPYYELYDYVFFFGGSTSYPADARSLARMHLREIQDKVATALGESEEEEAPRAMDDTTRAHLEEVAQLTDKVLDASFESNSP